MRRILEYGSIFITLMLLQVFLFDSLNISIYFYPMVYIGFLLVLPMNIHPAILLLLSLITGVTMDILSGTHGLHTIASLTSGFIRPLILNIIVGKDVVRDSGMPLPINIGRSKWFNYALIVISIHCFIFFFFETMTLHHIWFTIMRTISSITLTTIIVLFLAYLYPSRKQNNIYLR